MAVQSIYCEYELSLLSPSGMYVMALDTLQNFTLTRTVNAVGALTINLPDTDALWQAAQKDAIVEVWRRGTSGGLKRVMDGVWFVVKRERVLATNGERTVTLTCADQQDILRRYLVAYDSSGALNASPGANKSGAAETVIKSLVADNLTASGAGPWTIDGVSYKRPSLAAYITVEPDSARGYSPTAVAASWQNVLSICAQVARSSTQYLKYIAFDLEPQSPLSYVFRCYAGQRGVDRSSSSAFKLVLSDTNAAFGQATYGEDFTASASFMLCTGQTVSGKATTAVVYDATLDSAGPFAHTELYVSQQLAADTDTLHTQARDGLRKNRPVVGFSSVNLNQRPDLQLGVDFDFGDRLTAKLGNQLCVVRLEALTLSYTAAASESSPAETLTATLRSEYSP